MTQTLNTGNTPLPAGATFVASWDYDGPNDEIRTRFFYGARRVTGGHEVDIIGMQAGDGTVTERQIVVRNGDGWAYFASPQAARAAFTAGLAAVDDWEAALAAEQPSMACPLCDGRGDIDTEDTTNCAHAE